MADLMPPRGQSELFVATNLESWEARPPIAADQDGVCEECGYRLLDPMYHAWLWDRMKRARTLRDEGQLGTAAYEQLRGRFRTVHEWAVQRFGSEALLAAMGKLDPKRYRPPEVGGYDPTPFPVGTLDPPVGPYRFFVHVLPRSRGKVDAICERALALGWTPARLYQTCGRYRFPLGDDYGVVCFLHRGDRITEVTAGSIEITSPRGARGRVYRKVRKPQADGSL